jgi:hypothetical protein
LFSNNNKNEQKYKEEPKEAEPGGRVIVGMDDETKAEVR